MTVKNSRNAYPVNRADWTKVKARRRRADWWKEHGDNILAVVMLVAAGAALALVAIAPTILEVAQ